MALPVCWPNALAESPSHEALLAYMKDKAKNDDRANAWECIRFLKPEVYDPCLALKSLEGDLARYKYFTFQSDKEIWDEYPLTPGQIKTISGMFLTHKYSLEIACLLLLHNPLRDWPGEADVDLAIDLCNQIPCPGKRVFLLCEIVTRYTAQVPVEQPATPASAARLVRLASSLFDSDDQRLRVFQIAFFNWPLVTYPLILDAVQSSHARQRLQIMATSHNSDHAVRCARATRNMPVPAAAADHPVSEGDKACILCVDKKQAVVLIPCGHLFGCHACTAKALKLKRQCSVCNASVTSTQTVFSV